MSRWVLEQGGQEGKCRNEKYLETLSLTMEMRLKEMKEPEISSRKKLREERSLKSISLVLCRGQKMGKFAV